MFELARFTLLEVSRMRTYHLLLLFLTIIMPLTATIFSKLFLFDVGKVQFDILQSCMHAAAIIYILFIATMLLGRDIASGTCYFLLAPPLSRGNYLAGRFLGLSLAFLLLMLAALIASEVLTAALIHTKFPLYRQGIDWLSGGYLSFFVFIQYISLLAAAIFICSWATALAEMLTFTIAMIFFAWSFPAILDALQSPDVLQQIPPFVAMLIHGLAYLFPELDGAAIGLSLAHGLDLAPYDIIMFFIEHIGYTLLMMGAAIWLFARRNL